MRACARACVRVRGDMMGNVSALKYYLLLNVAKRTLIKILEEKVGLLETHLFFLGLGLHEGKQYRQIKQL